MSGDVLLALAMALSQTTNPGMTFRPDRAPVLLQPPPPAAPAPAAIAAKTPAPADGTPDFLRHRTRLRRLVLPGWKVSAERRHDQGFRRSESDARQARAPDPRIAAEPRGVIGGPAPSLEYWLSDGKPPQGPAQGLRVLPIDGPSLRVEQAQDQWVLRDERRVLFSFGQNQADARQALAVVQKYGFTQVGTVGAGARR